MPLLKTITVDEFYTKDVVNHIATITLDLPKIRQEYGYEVSDFNMVPPDIDEIFSDVLGKTVSVDPEKSGIFRIPELMIHFESFESTKDWIFVVALQESTFNLFEHTTGAATALDDYKFNYRNLFEWDLTVNYILKPGQGIFFRPWLFHSFNLGLIQIFTLKEL